MHDLLPVHEPLLVNTLGHSAGTVVFAIFLVLLVRDRAGARLRGSRLTLAAAALALAWNFASLLVIALQDVGGVVSPLLVAVSSSALSLLPAILLHLSLGSLFGWISALGYALAASTVGIHASEALFRAPENHQLALRMTTIGFGGLTLVAVAALLRLVEKRHKLTPRLVATMSLFLFSMSFVHLGSPQPHAWPLELVAHHAGIALALFVLLQDYRFLLLDAFVRFLANILFTALFVFALLSAFPLDTLIEWARPSAFREGMLVVGGCLLLLLYSVLRARIDHLLNRLVFPRNRLEVFLLELRTQAGAARDELGFLDWTAGRTAAFLGAALIDSTVSDGLPPAPSPVSDLPHPVREKLEAAGVEVVFPLRVSATESKVWLFGRRQGGRRYLSEDFQALARVQAEIVEQLERFREIEMRRLVSQAEMRALQSQIHPHFLFNALNTLYGVIPRQAEGARRTVLNLADIFRYFLQTDRALIPLEEEIAIVRAYLEIESLRLGDKLRVEIEVDPAALRHPIPVLTVEPLVENAVKHGVARKAEGGLVRVEAHLSGGELCIRVSDAGSGFDSNGSSGAGVGLENVARRLELRYGAGFAPRIESGASGTVVEFRVPIRQAEEVAR
jgi:signal transduction histidine kinase